MMRCVCKYYKKIIVLLPGRLILTEKDAGYGILSGFYQP